MKKHFSQKALIFVLLLIISLSIFLKLKTKQEELKTSLNQNLSIDSFFTPVDFDKTKTGLHLDEINNTLFQSSTVSPASCMTLDYATNLDWVESRSYDKHVLAQIKALHSKVGYDPQTELYSFCKNKDNFYLLFSNPENKFRYSLIPQVYAGSGKTSISIAMVAKDGEVKTVDGIEYGISKYFSNLSFYFSCESILGLQNNGNVLISCSGSEGQESTQGIVSVSFENATSEFISYCINPNEDLNHPFDEKDFTYTCYDHDMHVYYKGNL